MAIAIRMLLLLLLANRGCLSSIATITPSPFNETSPYSNVSMPPRQLGL